MIVASPTDTVPDFYGRPGPSPWHVSLVQSILPVEDAEWDAFCLHEACNLLEELALVTRDTQAGLLCLSLHPLIHEWAKSRLTTEQQNQAWLLAGSILALVQQGPSDWSTYGGHMSRHLDLYLCRQVAEILPESYERTLDIYVPCGWMLHLLREEQSVGTLLNEIFRKFSLDPERVDRKYMSLYRLLVEYQATQGRLSQALAIQYQIIDLAQVNLSKTDPFRLVLKSDLALLYFAADEPKKVIELLEPALDTWKEGLHIHDSFLLQSLCSLARAYDVTGRPRKAIKLLKEIERTQGTELPGNFAANIKCQLASAYTTDGQAQEAIQLLESLIKDHPSRQALQYNLAQAYAADGQTGMVLKRFSILPESTGQY
jgi:tetratricopeptide (TPR) repeat protein